MGRASFCSVALREKNQREGKKSLQPLIDYLEAYSSAEIMSQALKRNEKFGMGSAVGDKACHLFAKIYVSILGLVKYKVDDTGWTGYSYEVPFDSNAGRVLFRTGFLTEWASLQDYEDWEVIKPGQGKGGANYIRVTNIRGKKVSTESQTPQYFSDYSKVAVYYLKTSTRPRMMEVQRMPNVIIHQLLEFGKLILTIASTPLSIVR